MSVINDVEVDAVVYGSRRSVGTKPLYHSSVRDCLGEAFSE
jgi:hypothetical protein